MRRALARPWLSDATSGRLQGSRLVLDVRLSLGGPDDGAPGNGGGRGPQASARGATACVASRIHIGIWPAPDCGWLNPSNRPCLDRRGCARCSDAANSALLTATPSPTLASLHSGSRWSAGCQADAPGFRRSPCFACHVVASVQGVRRFGTGHYPRSPMHYFVGTKQKQHSDQ